MLVICAAMILEVVLGLIFPDAGWRYVRWVSGTGFVIICALLATRWRAP